MTTPNLELEGNEDEGTQLETPNPDPTNTSAPDPAQPAPTPQLNFQQLYNESVRLRIAAESELDRYRRETPAPRAAEAEITDEDIAQRPAQAIKELINRSLKAGLGDINEISADFKRGKQLEEAEELVFSTMPNLIPFRQHLATEVRKSLRNASGVDPSIYALALDAVIGRQAREAMLNIPAPAPAKPVQSGAPAPRPSGSPPSGNSPKLPKLGAMEKQGMKSINLDPEKPEDVQKYFTLISDEEFVP